MQNVLSKWEKGVFPNMRISDKANWKNNATSYTNKQKVPIKKHFFSKMGIVPFFAAGTFFHFSECIKVRTQGPHLRL